MIVPMSEEPDRLRTLAIGALLVHIGVGFVSLVLFLGAYQLRPDWIAAPELMVEAGPASAALLGWAAAADLVGYYLANGVLAYVLWRLLRPRSPALADLSTLAAMGYVLAGGAAAALLAVAGPVLITQYASAEGAEQAAIAASFQLLSEVVYRAVWQFLDALLLAAWWLGIALLVRVDQPRLALLTGAMAVVSAIAALLTLAGFGATRDLLLGPFFVAWMAWAIWLLLLFWRRSAPFAPLAQPMREA